LDRTGAKVILRQFDSAHALLRGGKIELDTLPSELRTEIVRISEMKSFREELSQFLAAHDLPSLTQHRRDGWGQFLHLYSKVIEDIPLEVAVKREGKQGATISPPEHISHVTVRCESATETIKHAAEEHVLFSVTWTVHDKNGQSGDIYVVNSFRQDGQCQSASAVNARAADAENVRSVTAGTSMSDKKGAEGGRDGFGKGRRQKRWIDFVLSVLLPASILLVVLAEHYGVFESWRGLDLVEEVADRFSHSYTPDASKPVYPEDAAWKPMIELIEKYSKVKLRTDKEPKTIARFQATLSTKEVDSFEWTSPSTPFVVLYRHWPENSGPGIPKEDYTVVGSIGDLQSWITQSKNDFHFLINDIVLGVIAVVFGWWLWRMNYLHGREDYLLNGKI